MKIIALDIGGTAVKSGLVDNGVLKEHRETPTPAAEGGQAVVALAKKLIAAYLPEGADGIGISTAGVVDSKSGSILFAEDCIRGYTGYTGEGFAGGCLFLAHRSGERLERSRSGRSGLRCGQGLQKPFMRRLRHQRRRRGGAGWQALHRLSFRRRRVRPHGHSRRRPALRLRPKGLL